MAVPYFRDDTTTLYHADMRDIVPGLGRVDAIVTDPPYGETNLTWDRWPDGWPSIAAEVADAMWCFGSMRMFLARVGQFTAGGWKLSQDVVWEKHNGSGFAADRFKRVHEHVLHWYRGPWSQQHRQVPTVPGEARSRARPLMRGDSQEAHLGAIGAGGGYVFGTTRLAPSVLRFRSMHHQGIHPTEKPAALLDLLIRYACPPGGVVLDPFAGSGSLAVAARLSGCRSVLIEADERYCERAAERLAQAALPFDRLPD